MAHLDSPPIIIDKTSKFDIVDGIFLDLCHSIVDCIFPSFYIVEKYSYYVHDWIWKLTKNSWFLNEVLKKRFCGTWVKCDSNFHGAQSYFHINCFANDVLLSIERTKSQVFGEDDERWCNNNWSIELQSFIALLSFEGIGFEESTQTSSW
jgi:hypothetical protein